VLTLRDRALNLLSRREHSRAELARKLAPHAESEAIAAVLDQLTQDGHLSDARYADAVAHARQGKHGSRRLAHELREKGVDAALIGAVVDAARNDDLAAARAVWQRKFGVPPVDAKDKARQYRFLLGRGFPADIVEKVFKTLGSED
jgi:regulatory protein